MNKYTNREPRGLAGRKGDPLVLNPLTPEMQFPMVGKTLQKFPMIGKMRMEISNDWKTCEKSFQ